MLYASRHVSPNDAESRTGFAARAGYAAGNAPGDERARGRRLTALQRDQLVARAVRSAVPAIGGMRYPIKFIVPVAVLLPLLAGYGFRAWLSGRVKSSALVWLLAAVMGSSISLMAWSRWRATTFSSPCNVASA